MSFLDPAEGLSPLLWSLLSPRCSPLRVLPGQGSPGPCRQLPAMPACLRASALGGRMPSGPLLVPEWSAAAWAIPDCSPGPRPEGPTRLAGLEQQPLPPLPPRPPWHDSGRAAFFSLPLAQGPITRCLFSTRQACPRAPGPQVKSAKICPVAGPSQPGGQSFPRST